MSRLEKISMLTLMAFTLSTASSVAWAAERGTYRPGSPYQSVPSQNAMTCETQCRSDRDCRGWNFLKVSPRQASGVCEFNAQSVAPISSAISISGDGSVGQVSSRLVSTGTRTIRVGSPEPRSARQAQPAQRSNLQSSPQPGQRIIREPIPRRDTVTPGHYRTPYSAPRLMHSLDGGRVTTPQRNTASRQTVSPYASPQNYSVQNPSVNTQPRLQHALGDSSIQRPHNHQFRPIEPVNTTYAPQQSEPRSQAPIVAPMRNRQQSRTHPQSAPARPPIQKPQTNFQPPVNIQAAEANLFGSLYDDVAQPKPMTHSEMADPNAPISTTTSVPAKRHSADALMGPADNQ